ncbi:putative poly [Apostichopus japonicus]|uniref:Poly [ADP-ribose] polymerase n=1 Tax=Stichopus japonicus TaxID=307972 RepID=A0A2G8JNV4_STIJA|nr:putative poly [Apostichopus japonicus]
MSEIEYPFMAEYAKSNRSSCKKCKTQISKESLRLARMIQSPHFDGKMPNWYHFSCFWTICRASAVNEIGGVDGLRWEDQQKIKDKISGKDDATSSKKGKKEDGSGEPKIHMLSDFAVEYAKSNRSKCKACDEKIVKDTVRVSKRDLAAAVAKGIPGPLDMWHHVDCFCKEDRLKELAWPSMGVASAIPGFDKLKDEDQKELQKKLGKRKSSAKDEGPAPKKAKAESKPKKPVLSKEETAMKVQSEFLWKIRDELYKNVANKDLKNLLTANNQDLPTGEAKLLDRVADGMAFGALERCLECKDGQLVASSTGVGYRCTGNLSGWTKCQNVTREAKRTTWIIPKAYSDNEYLGSFKFKPYNKGVRVFPPETEVAGSSSQSKESREKKVLEGCKIVVQGKLNKTKQQLKREIESLGGSVVATVTPSVACVISNEAEVEKMTKKIKDAKKCDVHVVSEEFLQSVKTGGAALQITEHSICDWGSDPHNRIAETTVDGVRKSATTKRLEDAYVKSAPKSMKMTIKGGGAVDPDSGLASICHILKSQGVMFAATLGMVDISRGSNSFYLLQLLKSDKSESYYVFRKWGRVGTTIGGNKLESFGNDVTDAKNHFKDLYLEKTGNRFGTKNFVKRPHKFYPLDIDYGEEEEQLKKAQKDSGSSSKLAKPIQELIKLIFDIEQLKKTMMEFEIDMEKMPLGKLSKKQIEKAYSVLTELQQLIKDEGKKTQILDASNRFYTLIPHNFGLRSIPLLDSLELIKTKTEMLDNLLEIEVAYSLLKTDSGDGSKDPLDSHYENLKCHLEVLDKKSKEFDMIRKFTKNSHAATHSTYSLEVEEVFKMDRSGEAARYKPFKKLHNRRLLWHGSRVTNFAGIISQGLRIAPPEAPVTGYMFGKGVYFADMVSKSANYCHTSYNSPTGLMLLCEVALGDMYELTGAEMITKLPAGKHSTFGMGRTAPAASGDIDVDGVTVQLGVGAGTKKKQQSTL